MIWIIILFLFIISVAIIELLIKKKKRKVDLSSYKKKEKIMNESEQALFISLRKALGDEYVVLSKVRIEDFVEVSKKNVSDYNNRWSLRGRIKSRHVDFLICDLTNTKPLLAIELDGKSHNDAQRQSRDQFVDELYKAIDLPIEHICVDENSSQAVQKIQEIIKISN